MYVALLPIVWAFPSIHHSQVAGCADKHTECRKWAATHQCDQNEAFMKSECPMACHSCGWRVGELAPKEVRITDEEAERLMRPASYGTCASAVQERLRWNLDRSMAEQVSCHNRKGAEPAGLWETTALLSRLESMKPHEQLTFYDSCAGKPLAHT